MKLTILEMKALSDFVWSSRKLEFCISSPIRIFSSWLRMKNQVSNTPYSLNWTIPICLFFSSLNFKISAKAITPMSMDSEEQTRQASARIEYGWTQISTSRDDFARCYTYNSLYHALDVSVGVLFRLYYLLLGNKNLRHVYVFLSPHISYHCMYK